MTGAAAVVDILKASGLMKEEDGKLVAATDALLGESSGVDVGSRNEVTDQVALRLGESATVVRGGVPRRAPDLAPAGMHVSIQIQIQCNAAEIEQLGPRLRQLLEELSRPSPESSGGAG